MFKKFKLKHFLLCLVFNISIVMSSYSFATSYIDEASNYTVRFRVLVDYPFSEDTNDDAIVRSWVGAGFVVDKSTGIIVTNAHVSGVGNTYIKIAFKGERFVKSN